MTNGRGAGMASFMTKKKKYKFQVEVCLNELLEVPFVSAVLFVKLRLLDGGNFQDHSTREEVKEHSVKWDAHFSFPCKMLANASTGILEPCILRISIRKECKGGRSFTKLGFVDLNLAEFAGSGVTSRKALLEGYDTRRRQDNSMLRFSIKMNMLSGDTIFKVPSPSLKHKPVNTEDTSNESRAVDEFSSGSLAGSIASGSSGFGSLPKKRPTIFASDLVIGHTLTESNVPVTVAIENLDVIATEPEDVSCEPGHSRNSSNTSQMSKGSGYSSIHSHSRQSSSGDSGHIRSLQRPNRLIPIENPSLPSSQMFSILNHQKHKYWNFHNMTVTNDESFESSKSTTISFNHNNNVNDSDSSNILYYTPKTYQTQLSSISSSSAEDYKTPENSLMENEIFLNNLNSQTAELQKSVSTSVVDQRIKTMSTIREIRDYRLSDNTLTKSQIKIVTSDRNSLNDFKQHGGVLRSKSDFEIPRQSPIHKSDGFFQHITQKSDSLLSFLTPLAKRRAHNKGLELGNHSTPKGHSAGEFKVPESPILKYPVRSLPSTRTTSPTSMRSRLAEGQQLNAQGTRGLPHRKLLEGTSGGKLAPVAISPDETATTVTCDSTQNPSVRRPSVTANPSSSSLVLSETGSLDRAKAALERRKKAQSQESDLSSAAGRVEGTRVNPNDLIAEILKNTNFEPTDDSAESSGLQLFIAKDGTAALGNHEVKSQISTGIQGFKQVVMEDKR